MNPNEIKPAIRGKSDFYSWQLYRWIKKWPHSTKIWAGTWNSVSGIDKDKKVLYIGDERDGEWIHARLLRNLCSYGENLDRWAYGPGHDTANWEDVTEKFWSEYMRIGVCAIHGDYAHRWETNGDERTCLNCREKEKQKLITVKKLVWEATK